MCEALERRCYKKYIKWGRDYSERLVETFSTEIQSENFGGNNYLSIEGVALEYYKNNSDSTFLTNNTFDESIVELHSSLSDDSKKAASKNTSHITDIIDILVTTME